jgi:3-isopropylmalate/(R)-2-methylmalate dehydratase small subunit
MLSTPVSAFKSRYVVLPNDNIDTDQIIPARFLTTTERTGLGSAAFHDWRYDRTGTPISTVPLNRPEAIGASILVTGRNFGCGSSREHAVWALLDAGFHAIVSTEFADIFRGNAISNGLLPIQVPAEVVAKLVRDDERRYGLAVDLEAQTLTLPDDQRVTFPISPFAKHRLLNGIDELAFLLGCGPDVARFEATHDTLVNTLPAEVIA